MAKRKLTAISLYTGVGGLDFGFEAAGFETAAAVELDPIACHTIRLNRPDWNLLEGDIRQISSAAMLECAEQKVGEPDVLIGGPPCQPFSKSSYWVNGDALRLEDPRAHILMAYLRVLKDMRPRAFLLENVYGLAYKGKDEGLKHLLHGIEEINRQVGTRYAVTWKMLNSAHFGVPQIRERIFIVGCRDGTLFKFPAPTHSDPNNLGPLDTILPFRTAWDSIGDLPQMPDEPFLEMGGKWADLLPTIPEGHNYLWHTNRGGGEQLFGWRTRYWSFLLKLAKNQPSWTIQAQPGSAIGPFHWCNRKLSLKEMCRIQTFPDDITFDCGRADAQKMLGNAVPSLLAEVLAREMRRQLLGNPTTHMPLKLIPSVRLPCPPPDPVSPLPAKYRSYIGAHPDHPGEGRLQAKNKVARSYRQAARSEATARMPES